MTIGELKGRLPLTISEMLALSAVERKDSMRITRTTNPYGVNVLVLIPLRSAAIATLRHMGWN